MALSNWFIVMWNTNGESYLDTPEISVNDYTIEVYKNWIQINYKDKWIMDVLSGSTEGNGFTIQAERGKQQSIYAIIEWMADGKVNKLYVIAGYTFIDDEDVGCLPETVKHFQKWVERTLRGMYEKPPKFSPAISRNQGDVYFSKTLGLPQQYQEVGKKPPKSYFDQILGIDK